jgi:predicted alpha/beta-fold hydrolase
MEETKEVYKITFIKYEETKGGGHIEYLMKVDTPGWHAYNIRDRYSNIRAFKS